MLASAELSVIHVDPGHPLQEGVLIYDRHSTGPEVTNAFLAVVNEQITKQ